MQHPCYPTLKHDRNSRKQQHQKYHAYSMILLLQSTILVVELVAVALLQHIVMMVHPLQAVLAWQGRGQEVHHPAATLLRIQALLSLLYHTTITLPMLHQRRHLQQATVECHRHLLILLHWHHGRVQAT